MENKKVVALAGNCCGKLGEIVSESKLKEYDWTVEFKFCSDMIERRDYKIKDLEVIPL